MERGREARSSPPCLRVRLRLVRLASRARAPAGREPSLKCAGLLCPSPCARRARGGAGDVITANALHPGFILTRPQGHLGDDTMRTFGVTDGGGT
ncbi:hypothetical protein GCM10017667_80110 [Streptomyces filamentosus]|uniref:Uncharacterized protein n=1 Tax=Streptomyces filamentosus TaxID=67294 RepID=A0A919ESQ4_STRFL|nr:hypothetical protein GCM10017667_80110 [Streptomyces filamentosus]